MQLAFYKDKGNFYDFVVRLFTLSKYSHCELVIDGISYSSSPRDNGVRSKVIDFNPEHWDIIEVNADKQKALDFFNKELGKKYDWRGAIKSVVPFLIKNDPNRWFCSEICAEALGIEDSEYITPVKLYLLCKDMK